jgi:hypothetical protein
LKFVMNKFSRRFFVYLLIAIVFIEFPIIGNYLRGLNTIIHESAHAFIALLGGHLGTISLLMDSEGITTGPQAGRLEGIFASISGYTFSSFMAFLSFWLINKNKFTLLTDILLGILFVSLILWVRNLYGIFWIVSFAIVFLIVVIKGSNTFIQHLLAFIASILLVDSVKSAFEILTMSFTQPFNAGDAANLAYLTMLIPAQAWGIFFFAQALLFSLLSLKNNLYKLEV